MPRGKVITEPSADQAKTVQNDSPEKDMNESKNASKFKLVESETEANADADEEENDFPEKLSEKPEHTPMNFKFTLLLVAVFVAVNIGLIALLDKDRPEENTSAARHGTAAAKNEA